MIIILLLNGVVDYYLYKIIKLRCNNKFWAKGYAMLSIIIAIAIVGVICLPRRTGSDDTLYFIMYGLITYFSIYTPKYVFLLFDFIAKIPMYGTTNSLNASVAAGIMIYEVIRNRK